ncbi:WXG100-like domain-containing protein [Nocardiopsis xinjiangensis]|uniref:WXG100-like domain-containing protein n=1 Tax=Nocardiopsis xinjiangensis TaxID=124285 RepID=UPI0006845EAB|nr:hypothetical protein [Nocardiopsis xinjiangensis]
MELPPELRNLFMVLTGSEWPTADETRLWELAQVYGTTADRLEIDLPQMVIRIKNRVRENFDATAADFFDESVDQFTAGERNYLGEGTAVARELQEYVHNAGTQVQYAKWTIIGQLVQLAAEIAWAIAMAPYTFGASMSQIPIFQAIARTVIGRVMFRLLSQLLQQMMISQFFALTMDALIQRIQIDNGVRDEWDQDLTEQAAQGATLDALFGTAAAFGGQALSDRFNRLLGNNTGPAIAHRLDDELPSGLGPGAGGGLPEAVGSVMGRNNDELLRPYGMDNTPGWSRPVDGERFRTDMGEGFADSLGTTMGRDQAREFGERYADAFARNWGRSGLDEALNNVVATHGRDLDPRMRDFLTTGVPNGVREGLSDVGTHWKTFLAQLGGQGIANAGQGMLSEGFYNLLFSDEKSFSITWLSGVSGLVSGALQQSLTQGGLLLVAHLERAGLPDGVPPLPEPPMGSAPDGGTTPGAGGTAPGGGGASPETTGGTHGEVSAADRSPSGQGEGEGAKAPDPQPASPERVTTESSGTDGPTTAPTGSSTGAGRDGDPAPETAPSPNDHGPYRPAAPPAEDGASEEDAVAGPGRDQGGDRDPDSTTSTEDVHLPAAPGQEEQAPEEWASDAPESEGRAPEGPEQEERASDAPVPDAEDGAGTEGTGARSPEERPSSVAVGQEHEDGIPPSTEGETPVAGEDGPTAGGSDGAASDGADRVLGGEEEQVRGTAGPPPSASDNAGDGPGRPGAPDPSTTRSPQEEADPDAPAPVSSGLHPPASWQATREGAEPARVGTHPGRSGVDTRGVEILDGSTKDRPITSIAERGFDVRRIPLPDPEPGGPDHVTELTVRLRFDAGEGVRPEEAEAARRTFLDRADEVLNQRYRLPGSGDQFHVRVEPVGPEGRPHSETTWSRDNPDLPGRSDTAHWRLDDGADFWLHEFLHRIGLNDEYLDPSREEGGRPPAVLRSSPDSTAVHRAGGYMDAPVGRGGRPPQVLNHYLEQIEAQVREASRYDPPARPADLPESSHRDLTALLDPEGTRDGADTMDLFGAAYDRHVRGRDEERVRADLPPRLRGEFDRTVTEWTGDGRWERALDAARGAGMEGPLSQMPTPAAPVTTQGDGDHRAAAPFSRFFGSGGDKRRGEESHQLQERPRHGRNRGEGSGTGEGPSSPPRSRVQPDGDASDPVDTEGDTSSPGRLPDGNRVEGETERLLTEFTRPGFTLEEGGFPGVRRSGADVDGLRQRLLDFMHRQGVEPVGEGFGERVARFVDRPSGPELEIPVRGRSGNTGAAQGQAGPPERGRLRVSAEQVWYDTTDSSGARNRPAHTAESRAKAVGSGSQQSRKAVNVAAPLTIIGDVAGHVSLLSPRGKVSYAHRQRGTDYQTSRERRHKRKIDVVGDTPARFTGHLGIKAALDLDPPRTAGPDGNGPPSQQPREGGDPADRPAREEEAEGRRTVEYSDALNGVFDVVLPGRLRTSGQANAPENFRTDHAGVPVRAARFSRALKILPGPGLDQLRRRLPNVSIETSKLHENLGRMDLGEVLRLPYKDAEGRWQYAEISGGPVAYDRIGPEMSDSSFSDTDKTSSTAQTSASRSNKLDGRIGLGARIGSEPSVVVRAGPDFGGGGKYVGKSTRSTEHGSERVRGPGAKGDSAYYTVERRYRITTTEDRPVPARPRAGAQGGRGAGGRAGPYTLSLTTLDQVLTSEASQLARAGTGDGNGGDGGRDGRAGADETRSGAHGDQDAPAQRGPSTGRRHLGDSVPVQAEWSDGHLRDSRHRAPFTAVADRVHRQVFAAHPELVNDPGAASDPHRGFFGQVWKGPDLRAANTMAIYEQVERAVAESDTLLSGGLPVVLRTGGMGNALTPAGRDDRDGAGFLTVRVTGSLERGRPDGSRSDGSLSSGLNAWTTQGSGKQVTTSGGADLSGGAQLRFGETGSGLPAGIFEVGASGSYEKEWVKPASYTRKSGVQAASTAKGDVDSWIYDLRLEASIGTGAPVDVTPTTEEGGQSRIRLRVEGPRTSRLPGEPGPDRAAGTPLGNAVNALEEARGNVETARTRLVDDEQLAGDLPDRVEDLRAAYEEATATRETVREAVQASTEAVEASEAADRAVPEADTRHREEERRAVRARAAAALAWQEAANRLREAAEAKLDHADALRGASGPPQGQDGGGRPQQPARPSPPEFVEAGTADLDHESGRDAVDSARRAAGRNWAAADAAMRSASDHADRISAAVAQAPRGTRPETAAAEQAWARAEEAEKGARARAEEAGEQEKAANRSRKEAAAQAGEARHEAVTRAEGSRQARDELARARDADGSAAERFQRAEETHNASESARDRLDTVREAFHASQREELKAHHRAAEDHRRREAQNFADERDARLRGRTELDLDALPHAPGNTDARQLGEAIEDAVREAPGYESSSRSGEAVAQYRRHFGSPKALAAHSSDLHNGALPLQSQFEDGTFQRANISHDLRAERTSMRVSDAVPDSSIQLTYKTESTRSSGTGGGSAVNTNIGFKGEGTPNPSDSRHNRLGGQVGVVPYSTKGDRNKGSSLTFTEEDALTLPGTTVKVTATEELTLDSTIRNRYNFGASLPYGSTDSAQRVLGSPTGDYGEQVTSETRYRALDLAQNGSLAGPHGLDTALTDARSASPRIGFVPGNEGTGYALDGIDTKRALQGIVDAVGNEGFTLTEQSKHDIRVALSPTNTRGTNRRLQNGGLVLSVNTLRSGSERGFSTGGWMRLQLAGDSDGAPGFGSVESGFSSARTDSESPEQNSSEGKQRKHGLTAGVGGGFNPVPATGTDSDGAPVFPSDRYWAVPFSAGTGWESATTKTDLTSDTKTENTTRTVTAPGINVTRPMKVRFTLSLDNRAGTVLTGDVRAGTRQEIAQTGSFRLRPEQAGTPEAPPSVPVPAGDRREDLAADPDAFARTWRGQDGRSALPEAMVEDVGYGPISHAMLTAQARALGWEPSAADRSDAGAAVDHLRKKKPGARAPVLGAAADGQVLREQFGKASRDDSGAFLVGKDGQGPFAVPGLETQLYTRPDPSGATILGTGEMETERDHQHLHRQERSEAQAGSTALNTGTDASGMKGLDPTSASDFQEDSVIVGGGPSTAGANSTAAGGGKHSSSSMRTDTGSLPEKGRGYLVRVPVQALLVAQAGSGKKKVAAEEVGTTVDLWLSREQITALGAGVSDQTFELWNTVAISQAAAAGTEKDLGTALDGELGLKRDENPRVDTRAALDLLTFPGADPQLWSPETSDAVGVLRDYFGPASGNGMGRQTAGWGTDQAAGERAAQEQKNRAEEAERALQALRRGSGPPEGLAADTVEALDELYVRRDALHEALSKHRQALDHYFDALRGASTPEDRTTDGPTDRTQAVGPPGTPAAASSSGSRQEQLNRDYSEALGTA